MLLYGMVLCKVCSGATIVAVVYCTVRLFSGQYLHHSHSGNPAVVCKNGTKKWYKNGALHRIGSPAIEYASGGKYWYVNGKFHRDNGPAIEDSSGYRAWYQNSRSATEINNQEIIIGKPIEIGDSVGTVLRHVVGVFYEALLGNKKILVAKV